MVLRYGAVLCTAHSQQQAAADVCAHQGRCPGPEFLDDAVCTVASHGEASPGDAPHVHLHYLEHIPYLAEEHGADRASATGVTLQIKSCMRNAGVMARWRHPGTGSSAGATRVLETARLSIALATVRVCCSIKSMCCALAGPRCRAASAALRTDVAERRAPHDGASL